MTAVNSHITAYMHIKPASTPGQIWTYLYCTEKNICPFNVCLFLSSRIVLVFPIPPVASLLLAKKKKFSHSAAVSSVYPTFYWISAQPSVCLLSVFRVPILKSYFMSSISKVFSVWQMFFLDGLCFSLNVNCFAPQILLEAKSLLALLISSSLSQK